MTTVGTLLKEARIQKNLTLKQVEKALRVREKFLVALEEDDWSIFSSRIYITGLIRNYSILLGTDTEKMLLFFRRDYERKDDLKFKKRNSATYLTSPTKRLAMAGLMFILFIFAIYFSYQLKLFLSPPGI